MSIGTSLSECEIGAVFVHRLLEFLDEQPLAADVGERLIGHPVPLRGQAEQLDRAGRIERREARAHVLGLPQRERRSARRNHQSCRQGGRGEHRHQGKGRRRVRRRSAVEATRFDRSNRF
jgi:hypothetical protein